MSLLPDYEIRRLCANGLQMIKPFSGKTVRERGGKKILSYGLDAAGYDLRLKDGVKFFSADSEEVVDPKDFKERTMIIRRSGKDGSIVIPRGTTALGRSVEHIKMPNNVWALVIAKSTYARCGVTLNATKIVPGWEGDLVLEISNMTPNPVKIYPDEGIASIVFFSVPPPDVLYSGLYQKQKGITLPKV